MLESCDFTIVVRSNGNQALLLQDMPETMTISIPKQLKRLGLQDKNLLSQNLTSLKLSPGDMEGTERKRNFRPEDDGRSGHRPLPPERNLMFSLV